jgi:Holliday junction resolvase
MAFRRGYRAELELVDLLLKEGFYTVRVPVSGGRGFPCDVLAAKGDDKRAYEVKSTKEKVYYFYEDDIEPLLEFSKKFDFQAYIAVRWKYKKRNPWTFAEVTEVKPLKIYRNR